MTGEIYRRTLKSPQIPGKDGQFSVEVVPRRADWTNVCDTFVSCGSDVLEHAGHVKMAVSRS